MVRSQAHLNTEEFYVGAQGGGVASMVWFAPDVPQSALRPLLTWNAGAVFRYVGNRFVGLQVEVNYLQRGWQEIEREEQDDGTEKIFPTYSRRLDYIQIPFLTHIYFGNQYRGFFNIGPHIGYCLSDRHLTTPPSTEHQYAPIDNRFDWGVAASLGFYAITIAGVWQAEARFNFSLGTDFSSRAGGYFSNSNNMNLSLNIAYLWQIKAKRKR